jgi:transcription elongation factor GreA
MVARAIIGKTRRYRTGEAEVPRGRGAVPGRTDFRSACEDGPVTRPGAADLLRAVGLLADGPVRWGQPVPAHGPGIYLVELPEVLPTAPLDMAKVGKWLDHVPGLRLDGERPTGKSLTARLASLWLPDATVLYAGATATSVGGRAAALFHHVLGEPRPHADGHWLHALHAPEATRLWWAATDAPEEYLDAVLEAFAAAPAPTTLPSGATRPPGALLLPWASTRRPTGERQVHGLTASVLPLPEVAPTPPTRVVEMPPGDADGAFVEARGSGTVRRAPTIAGARATRPAAPHPAAAAPPAAVPAAAPPPPRVTATRTSAGIAGRVNRGGAARPSRHDPPVPVEVSADAHARMTAELDELTRVRRPEVVARIKAARELGDLRENSEYHAAREEQSFLEGRVQLLEARLRHAVIVAADGGREDGPGGGSGGALGASLGSRVTVEAYGETSVFTLVGSTEADARTGRISTSSPVGAALLGATPGAEVVVRTPRGDVGYRVVSVD